VESNESVISCGLPTMMRHFFILFHIPASVTSVTTTVLRGIYNISQNNV